MSLVTIHRTDGQTLGDLVTEIKGLNGDAPVRTVSGRTGVLVDQELAHRVLARRLGLDTPVVPVEEVSVGVVVELEPPLTAPETAEVVPTTEPAPVAAKLPRKPSKAAAAAAKTKEV